MLLSKYTSLILVVIQVVVLVIILRLVYVGALIVKQERLQVV